MEKCKNDLLQMLQSILGETGAAAEYALMKALEQDLENKKNPEYSKHAERATEHDFEEDAQKLPDEKTEGTTTKTLEDRLDVEMERELTVEDYEAARVLLARAEHCYLCGDHELCFSDIDRFANRRTLERLEEIFELVVKWIQMKLDECPTLEENLDKDGHECSDADDYKLQWSQFWQDYKSLPTSLSDWTDYISESAAFNIWEKTCFGIKDDDERISELADQLKDVVLDTLYHHLVNDREMTIQSPEIMSELVDRLWASNLSFVRTNEKIKLI